MDVKTTCPQCDGKGYIEEKEFETGNTVKTKCDTCGGEGYLLSEKYEGTA